MVVCLSFFGCVMFCYVLSINFRLSESAIRWDGHAIMPIPEFESRMECIFMYFFLDRFRFRIVAFVTVPPARVGLVHWAPSRRAQSHPENFAICTVPLALEQRGISADLSKVVVSKSNLSNSIPPRMAWFVMIPHVKQRYHNGKAWNRPQCLWQVA